MAEFPAPAGGIVLTHFIVASDQQAPMSQAVTRVPRGRIESNALKHKPSTRAGVMITGGGYQGKTETACEVAADFEDAWLELHHHLNPTAVSGTRDLHAPVA